MTNLTISVDNKVLKKARIKALKEDTSVNKILATYLNNYAHDNRKQKVALLNIIKLSSTTKSGSGKKEEHEKG